MNVRYSWATQQTVITLDASELKKLVHWFEGITNPAPDPDADDPSKLEDMLGEIIRGEEDY